MGLGDNGNLWEFQRIGTESEKGSVEKELQELRARLSEIDNLKKRRAEIDDELAKVWIEGGKELEKPAFVHSEGPLEGANA